jgi:hypothetical protein
MPSIANYCVSCNHNYLDRQGAVLMPFVAERALGRTPVEITPDWGLRDLPLGWAHTLCYTLHCQQCGMIFLDMRFDEQEMQRLYANYRGPDYETQREKYEPGYANRNKTLLAGDAHISDIETLLKPLLPERPAILDWGGDTGVNTPLRSQAKLHHVLDISGNELVTGAKHVTSADHWTIAYDLVVLSNILEHAPSPKDLMSNIVLSMHAMPEKVKLYIEVPFEALMQRAQTDPEAWRSKRHWHEHINFFSEAALKKLIESAGLEVLAVHKIKIDKGGSQLAAICELTRTDTINKTAF